MDSDDDQVYTRLGDLPEEMLTELEEQAQELVTHFVDSAMEVYQDHGEKVHPTVLLAAVLETVKVAMKALRAAAPPPDEDSVATLIRREQGVRDAVQAAMDVVDMAYDGSVEELEHMQTEVASSFILKCVLATQKRMLARDIQLRVKKIADA